MIFMETLILGDNLIVFHGIFLTLLIKEFKLLSLISKVTLSEMYPSDLCIYENGSRKTSKSIYLKF